MGSELPSLSPATTTTAMSASLLVEATGDSESDSPAAAVGHGVWPVDADEGDAESCCGGEDGGGGAAASAGSFEALPWESWMRECCASYQLVVGDVGKGKCAASSATQDAADSAPAVGVSDAAESDRLFWEACIELSSVLCAQID